MSAFFAAIDLTSLTTGVTTVLLGMIGVALLYTGYRYAKRALAS